MLKHLIILKMKWQINFYLFFQTTFLKHFSDEKKYTVRIQEMRNVYAVSRRIEISVTHE